ncbi:hypothetical protein EJB05_26276 [Eragrostis curvula]|uniref:AAA+ ATPase domain-containing protein n=1 Tax=Eragrostis curvula TaxID=38414 RepID=A0A5J9UL53_9POAL|nr:hypothetical protein EJB05_26276 [Eragrostis curvula]
MNLVVGAVGSVIPKLLQLLGDEYKLQRGVKKNVDSLSKELKHIHAFLSKVSDVPWDQLDEQVQEWASEIREASYDMEDIIDTFLVSVEGREPTGRSNLKRTMNKMANVFSFSKGKARHDVGSAIQDIIKKLQEVADRRARYKIHDLVVKSSATTSSFDPRLNDMYKEVASLVGIEEPSKKLISMLSSRTGHVAGRKKIVSIVGTGGLGKTTLAKAVYDKLKADFECGAFVPVGRNPSLRKVFMDILYELDKNKYANIHTKDRDERHLIDDIREFLVNKRYFIVIDDLWENESWKEAIELALPENSGSRIIITTRNSTVAEKIGDEVYKIQPLSDDNSKNLFYARIFGDEKKCLNDQSDEISNKFLRKCGGIPLAIITMASLLVGKPREKWSDVFTSIGFGKKMNEQVENTMKNTMKILSFSYYDMPSYLRTCLLYLSVFPEDSIIDKDSLIWKWIAEGFIQEQQGISLFELSERYFSDLVNRSMIQAIEYEWNGEVYACRVHDMVLDLICSLSSKENFVTIIDYDRGSLSTLPSSTRRLAQHNITLEHTADASMVGTLLMPQLRSFIISKCDGDKLAPLSSFKHLRVLDMECCSNVTSSHLVHLGTLLHLRYLGIGHTNVKDLPNEIGALKLLQTLNFRGTRITQLTPSISRLTQLVCLHGSYTLTVAPHWIGKLASLEKLHVRVDSSDGNAGAFFQALGSLSKLRVLWIGLRIEMDDDMERDFVLSLRKLHKLQDFLFNPTFGSHAVTRTNMWGEAGFVLPQHLRHLDLEDFCFSWLPSCISAAYLPYLAHLTLTVDAMDQKGLEFLATLPEVSYLKLDTKSTATVSNISVGNGYFQKLRFCQMPSSMIQFQFNEEDSSISFHIWNGIDAMPFDSGKNDCSIPPSAVMPNLKVLSSVRFVRALKDGNNDCANIGLQYISSLQKVEVKLVCSGASAVEVEEAEAALRKATKVHQNRPTLKMWRSKEEEMVSGVQTEKAQEDDNVPTEELQKQQEGEATADEGISKLGAVNSSIDSV